LEISQVKGRGRDRPRQIPGRSAAPWKSALAGGLAGLILTLILQFPAAWLASALQQLTEGRVLLSQASGTIWSGSARLVLSGGTDSQSISALPGRLEWRARPQWDGLTVQLLAECCTTAPLSLAIRPRWGGVRLDVQPQSPAPTPPIQLPADLLTGLGAPWNTLEVEGQLRLTFQGLSVEWTQGRMSIAGRAELIASGMSSRLSTLKPMGSYRITITGGNTTRLELATLDGSLQLSGTGQWVGSRLRFTGEASAAPDREAALSNLLNIIGRRNGPRSIISVG